MGRVAPSPPSVTKDCRQRAVSQSISRQALQQKQRSIREHHHSGIAESSRVPPDLLCQKVRSALGGESAASPHSGRKLRSDTKHEMYLPRLLDERGQRLLLVSLKSLQKFVPSSQIALLTFDCHPWEILCALGEKLTSPDHATSHTFLSCVDDSCENRNQSIDQDFPSLDRGKNGRNSHCGRHGVGAVVLAKPATACETDRNSDIPPFSALVTPALIHGRLRGHDGEQAANSKRSYSPGRQRRCGVVKPQAG